MLTRKKHQHHARSTTSARPPVTGACKPSRQWDIQNTNRWAWRCLWRHQWPVRTRPTRSQSEQNRPGWARWCQSHSRRPVARCPWTGLRSPNTRSGRVLSSAPCPSHTCTGPRRPEYCTARRMNAVRRGWAPGWCKPAAYIFIYLQIYLQTGEKNAIRFYHRLPRFAECAFGLSWYNCARLDQRSQLSFTVLQTIFFRSHIRLKVLRSCKVKWTILLFAEYVCLFHIHLTGTLINCVRAVCSWLRLLFVLLYFPPDWTSFRCSLHISNNYAKSIIFYWKN